MTSERHDSGAATPSPLRLRAEDLDDLPVVSACLQDAVTRLSDMSFERPQRRYVMLVNRFRWEHGGRDGGERVRAALQANHVMAVRLRNVDRDNRDGILELLAVTAAEREGGTDLLLTFAGGGEIALEAEVVDIDLTDIGAAWPTPNRPSHRFEDDPPDGGG